MGIEASGPTLPQASAKRIHVYSLVGCSSSASSAARCASPESTAKSTASSGTTPRQRLVAQTPLPLWASCLTN